MAVFRYREIKGSLLIENEPQPIDAEDRGVLLVLLIDAYSAGEISLDNLVKFACSIANGYSEHTARNHVGWVIQEANKQAPPKRKPGRTGTVYGKSIVRLACWLVDLVNRDEGLNISQGSRDKPFTAYHRAAQLMKSFGISLSHRQIRDWDEGKHNR